MALLAATCVAGCSDDSNDMPEACIAVCDCVGRAMGASVQRECPGRCREALASSDPVAACEEGLDAAGIGQCKSDCADFARASHSSSKGAGGSTTSGGGRPGPSNKDGDPCTYTTNDCACPIDLCDPDVCDTCCGDTTHQGVYCHGTCSDRCGPAPAAGGATGTPATTGAAGSSTSTGGTTGTAGGPSSGGASSAGGSTGTAGGRASGGAAGGGGMTGSGGAPQCHPPTSDGQCELSSRCGCSPAQNCTYVGSSTRCVAAGAVPVWGHCTYANDCPAGTGCVASVCHPLCESDSDCGAPGEAYRACFQVLDTAMNNQPFVGYKVCTQQCNPMDPANSAGSKSFGACGPGTTCVVSSLGVSGTTNCLAAGTSAEGAACSTTTECAAGLVCAPGLDGKNVCSTYCRMGHEKEDCPSFTCDSGSSSATVYGVCNALSRGAVGTGAAVVQYGYCTLDRGGC